MACVVEAGVYRSGARHINWWFYNRKMYLIDTFEWFDEWDITIEDFKFSIVDL